MRSAGRGLEREMEQLRDVSYEALLDLFPEETLSGVGRSEGEGD